MRLERLKRGVHRGRCAGGCRSMGGGKDIGYRAATHRFWLLGRPTLLCGRCAPVWEKAYGDARDGWPDEAKDAA